MPSLSLRGDVELLAKLESLKQLRELRGTLLLVGAHVAGEMEKYPAASHRPQPFKTEKQRRGFFAKLRSGEIQVPYRRGQSPGSRNLKQQWNVTAASDTRVVISNPTPYGPLVQSAESQAYYHKQTGWPTDESVLKAEEGTVVKFFNDALIEIVER